MWWAGPPGSKAQMSQMWASFSGWVMVKIRLPEPPGSPFSSKDRPKALWKRGESRWLKAGDSVTIFTCWRENWLQ